MRTEERIRQELEATREYLKGFLPEKLQQATEWVRCLEWVLEENPITDDEFTNIFWDRLLELEREQSDAN